MRDINKEVQLPNGIAAPNPLSNIDYYYGIHNSIQDALTNIPFSLRAPARTAGIKMSVPDEFGVFTDKIVEYWWNSDDMSDGGFKPKSINLLAGDGIIIDNVNGGYKISAPKEADTSIKSFYVNEGYTGGGSTFKGDGSILKPFKKLIHALETVIGSGTAVSPEFRNANIILMSRVICTKSDIDSVPKLKGRLSINTISITSESPNIYEIVYDGDLDYPFDTKSLCEQDLLENGGGSTGKLLSQNISFKLSNLNITTRKTTGVVRSWNYDEHNAFYPETNSSGVSISSVTLYPHVVDTDNTLYKKIKNADGSDVLLFGSVVYGYDSLPKSLPTLHLYGLGNVKEGRHSITDITVFALNGPAIKIEKTTVNMNGTTTVLYDPYRTMVNNLTPTQPGVYLPKENVPLIELDSAWCRIENIKTVMTIPLSKDSSGNYNLVGGFDSYFSLKKTHSDSYHFTLKVLSGIMDSFNLNYLLTCNSVDIPFVILSKCDFQAATTKKQAFYRNLTNRINIDISGSFISNVKSNLISNVDVGGTKSTVNGFDFFGNISSSWPNDADAKSAGLIPGNIYYNTTINAMKQIRS